MKMGMKGSKKPMMKKQDMAMGRRPRKDEMDAPPKKKKGTKKA